MKWSSWGEDNRVVDAPDADDADASDDSDLTADDILDLRALFNEPIFYITYLPWITEAFTTWT